MDIEESEDLRAALENALEIAKDVGTPGIVKSIQDLLSGIPNHKVQLVQRYTKPSSAYDATDFCDVLLSETSFVKNLSKFYATIFLGEVDDILGTIIFVPSVLPEDVEAYRERVERGGSRWSGFRVL